MMFTASDYAKVHSLVFSSDYPGYTPGVVESPNGDGVLDVEKRYAHIATKYLEQDKDLDHRGSLVEYLHKAHELAMSVAVALGIPPRYWPDYHQGCLRVLEYSPTATTAPHTDFDLFTLMLYRNDKSCFKYLDPKGWEEASGNDFMDLHRRSGETKKQRRAVSSLNDQLHFGELMEEINPRVVADHHEVVASNSAHQYSIVYFAVPPESAVLPSGSTVGEWLKERKARSRVVTALTSY